MAVKMGLVVQEARATHSPMATARIATSTIFARGHAGHQRRGHHVDLHVRLMGSGPDQTVPGVGQGADESGLADRVRWRWKGMLHPGGTLTARSAPVDQMAGRDSCESSSRS